MVRVRTFLDRYEYFQVSCFDPKLGNSYFSRFETGKFNKISALVSLNILYPISVVNIILPAEVLYVLIPMMILKESEGNILSITNVIYFF